MSGARQRSVLVFLLIFLIFYPTTIFLRHPAQEQEAVNYWSKNPHNIHSHPFGDKVLSGRFAGVQSYARSKLDWPGRYQNNVTNSTTNGPTPGNNTYPNSTEPGFTGAIDCRGDYSAMSFLLRLICDAGMQHYALLMTYVAIGAVALGIIALFAIYLSICLCGGIHCACEQNRTEKTMRKRRIISGGGPLEELLMGIEEREGLEITDCATTKVTLPKIKRKRARIGSYTRWVQGELNARKKNTASIEEVEKASAPISRAQEPSESRENLLSRELRVDRSPLMPTVSELVIQASPRVVSSGNDARPGGENSRKKNPWRIAGWGFASSCQGRNSQ